MLFLLHRIKNGLILLAHYNFIDGLLYSNVLHIEEGKGCTIK